MDKKYTTNSYKQTQKLGEILAKEIISRGPLMGGSVILLLKGNLGGGKTTFIQGFAKGLGIKEKILSPTFVIMKRFNIKRSLFKNLYHLDCYRLKNEKDILELDFQKIIKDPGNIIAVEWPEKIKKAIPKKSIIIDFNINDRTKREIKFKI